MEERIITAMLSVALPRASLTQNLKREEHLSSILCKKLGYSYQKKYITYNKSKSITIFTIYGPRCTSSVKKQKRFRENISLVAEQFKQRFVAFVDGDRGAEIVTSDLGSVIEYLDKHSSNWIVSRYSAWVLDEPFSTMDVSSVKFLRQQRVRPSLFKRISSSFLRRKYMKRFKK